MAKESLLSRLPFAAKAGIAGGVVVLTGVVYLVLFYGDVANSIRQAEQARIRLQDELANAKRAEFAYQKDLAELTDRQQRQRELSKVLPEDAQLPGFLSAVQNTANVAGINLQAWSPMPEVQEKYYSRVPMKLQVQGRFHHIAKFFYQVGQLDRIINLEEIELTLVKQDADEILVKVEALATAFRALPKSAAGPESADKRGAAAGK